MDDLQRIQRVNNIIENLSLKEKVSLMVHMSSAIKSQNIDYYNWWNEGLHGVGRAGRATVFPQAIGLAATFDEDLIKRIADVISTEARAKYNESKLKEYTTFEKLIAKLPVKFANHYFNRKNCYHGLTYWSPNINIFRDPRWGRGQETYGEDPYLTSRLGMAFVNGLQSEDENHIKVIATPKHFAVHSGPEKLRHEFNAIVNHKDLHETYLYAFKKCIVEAKAGSIMTAYNAINGIPASCNSELLIDILRNRWNFNGVIVSDCGGLRDIYKHHKYAKDKVEAVSMSVNATCDLNCGFLYKNLKNSVETKQVSESTIDNSVRRILMARANLGILTTDDTSVYDSISPELIECKTHQELALNSTLQSIVLLKNGGVLPLNKKIDIAITGPNSNLLDSLLGNYNGMPSSYTTPYTGIKNVFEGNVVYTEGCKLVKGDLINKNEIIEVTKQSEVTVVCLGLSPRLEGEEGDAFNSDASGDKVDLQIPSVQLQLLREVRKHCNKVITVILCGSPLNLTEVEQLSDAIVYAWYPGQSGGEAIAKILCGEVSPSAKLPVTFVNDERDLPHFHSYSMYNRTYRYFNGEVQYPFGFGLSYTTCNYDNLVVEQFGNTVKFMFDVTNTGDYDVLDTVQCYFSINSLNANLPKYQLCRINKVYIKSHEKVNISVDICYTEFSCYNNNGDEYIPSEDITVYISNHQPDNRSFELTGVEILKHTFKIER